jgi:fatty acid desaturase
MKASDVFTREEIQDLLITSNGRGFLALFTTWVMIAGSFFLVASYPNSLSIFVAIIILGGRHLALAILMHDASHYSLFKTKWLNDFVGCWFCAYPTWQDLGRYRPHHMAHHKYAGSLKDPDYDLVAGFPVKKSSLQRKFLRDLFGITGLKRVFGLLLMDLGFINYTVSSSVVRLDQSGRNVKHLLLTGVKNLHGVIITNLGLFLVLKFFHHPELYWLWILSYLIPFSVFVRIRSIAEHACTQMDLDPLKNTRTTYASPLARVTVAPHYVNYHLEHHFLMSVPHYKFKRMHQLLLLRNVFQHGYLCRSYTEVLSKAVGEG